MYISETIALQPIDSMCGGFTKDWEGKKVIPSCVVSARRKEFPEADGNYTGLRDPSINEIDLAFL